jgi:hypothetical protein
VKLTRQGVRDLGNNTRRYRSKYAPSTCVHVWEDYVSYDRMNDLVVHERRCGFCHEVR